MNSHLGMITLSVHICSPPLLILQKRIAAGLEQHEYNFHGSLLRRLHQRCLIPNSFLIDNFGHHRGALTFRKYEIYGCQVASSGSVMQRGSPEDIWLAEWRAVLVDGFQHFKVCCLTVGWGVVEGTDEAQGGHLRVSHRIIYWKFIAVQYLVHLVEFVGF